MDCAPMLSKRKRYQFEAVVRLHSLVAVPYVNAVTFAKLRLLDTRHSSQYSPRVEIRNHTVTWNTEHRFTCKFRSNMGTNVLEPKILKISIRMETKGGKSFYKVGFVSVNLACFAAMGSATSRRRYILEGYDEKHKRQDNSLLLVSFSMRQLFGDTCFRIPLENLSNCLVEPPDSDEGESLSVEDPDNSERKLLSGGPIGSLLGSDMVAANGQASSSPFERRLHKLNLDPRVTASERYASQPVRSNSAVSTCFTCVPHMLHPNASGTNLLTNTMTVASEGLPPLQRDHPALPPDELVSLLNKLFPPSSSESPLDDPELQNITITNSTESINAVANTHLPMGGDVTVSRESSELPNLVSLSVHNRRSASCPAAHQSRIDSGSRILNAVEAGDHNPGLVSSSLGVDTGGTGEQSSIEESSGRTGSTEAVPVNNFSSSSSVTPTSFSSTPGSTATGSPVAHVNPSAAPDAKCVLNPTADPGPDQSTSHQPNPIPLGLYDGAFDQDAACRSLPLPLHYSACRRRCDLRIAATSSVIDPLRHKPSEYFATDTGLLLPSRRRKSRPLADFAFPPSQMCVCPAVASRDMSNCDRDLDETADTDAGDTTTDNQTGLSLTSYRSTGLESHSSGYQSHSRQSSLESQAVSGSICVLASGNTGLSATTTVSALPPHPAGLFWHSRIDLPPEETPSAPR